MLTIKDPHAALPHSLLDAPGGFAWWYVDLLGDDDTGCVLIGSFGLPFLPGRTSRARRGTASPARSRPSLNVATYAQGCTTLYTLVEFPEQDGGWTAGTEAVRLGDSWLRTWQEGPSRHLEIELDAPLVAGGGRLTGSVGLSGAACVVTDVGDDPHHQWSPLCTAATGRAVMAVDGRTVLDVQGRAYHDRNGSSAGLDGLGIRHWLWGRAPVGDGERIWYLLWPHRGAPEAHGLEVGPDGVVTLVSDLTVRPSGRRVATFGMPWWKEVVLERGGVPWLTVHHERIVDDGFFYLRWIAQVRAPDGRSGRGFAEAVRPGRVDRWWNRPLVRMAVHRTQGPNSRFLPWFSGVRRPLFAPPVSPEVLP